VDAAELTLDVGPLRCERSDRSSSKWLESALEKARALGLGRTLFSFRWCSNKLNNMQLRTPSEAENVDRVLELAQERLREFGMAFKIEPSRQDSGIDATITISRGEVTATYSVQVKASMTLASVARFDQPAGSHPLLVMGPRINSRSAAAFRDAQIQFLDTLGNAFISFGGVLIDVRGRTAPADQRQATIPLGAGRQQPANLFSPGRAQVILALLTWPELVGERVRQLASTAGVSVGQAHDALTQLAEAGFLVHDARRMARSGELLDYWTAAYPTGLGRRLETARYHGDPSRSISSERPVYLSGESAQGVDIARPTTLTVYLDSVDSRLPIANRWSANPDRVRNVFVRRKFWVSPRPGEEDPSISVQNAPWPLVYADLLATGDARLAEVARTWRVHRARFDQS
jgi:hypothetical protein